MLRHLGRWWPSIFLAVAAVVFVAGVPVAGHPGVGVGAAVALLVFAWLISPALFPASADLDMARRQAEQGRAPLVFWKPGCTYCILLRVRMGATGTRVSWVDSSVDEAARAVVRSLNGGDHTTPTVMFRDESRTNPDAAWVRSLVR